MSETLDIVRSEEYFEVSEDDFEVIKNKMKHKVYFISFQKTNGEVRDILCTLSSNIISILSERDMYLDDFGDNEFATYGMSERQVKQYQNDKQKGYVNIFDVGMGDFRKINRTKLFAIQEVSPDNLTKNKITELVALYNVKTRETETRMSKEKSVRSTSSKPKVSVACKFANLYGDSSEKYNIEVDPVEKSVSVTAKTPVAASSTRAGITTTSETESSVRYDKPVETTDNSTTDSDVQSMFTI